MMAFGCVLMGSIYAALFLIWAFHVYGLLVVIAAIWAAALYHGSDWPVI